MFDLDTLVFNIEVDDSHVINGQGKKKYHFIVRALINDKVIEDDSVCINLYNLAVAYQFIKMQHNKAEVSPFVCVCGDNGCIGVFSGLKQNYGLVRVEWEKQPEHDSYTDPEMNEYTFLKKRKYSFNKKAFLSEVDKVFKEIETLKANPDVVYDVNMFFDLDDAISIWKGLVPKVKSKTKMEIIKEAVDNGEDVDPTEVLSIKDIIKHMNDKDLKSKE